MLESDNQLILDEYMQRKISYDRFEAEARLWDNYSTDYYPVVFFAKEHGIPFIATNIPRRYANSVKNGGLEVLDSLSAEAKKYIAPLPVPFEYNEKESEAAFSLMNMMGGKKTGDNEKLAQAQAVKDATMGWFIARNMKDKFLHINGSYHSDFKSGIIPYLLRYRPGTSVVTVTSVRQESISKLDDENKHLRIERMQKNKHIIDKYIKDYMNWLNLRSVTNYIKEFKELGNFIVRDRVKSFENKCKDKEDAKLAEILIKSTSDYYINRAIKVLKNERAKGREDECLKILTEIFTKK